MRERLRLAGTQLRGADSGTSGAVAYGENGALKPTMAAIVYLVASGIASWILSRRFALSADREIRTLVCLVVWGLLVLVPVQAVAALQIAGAITVIRLWVLAAIQVVILIAVVWSSLRSPTREKARESREDSVETDRAQAGPREATVASVEPLAETSSRIPAYLWIGSGVVVCSYLVFAVNLLSSYPSGWDALAYHLPVALHWLQSGSLRIPPSLRWQYGLPGNAEIGMMLLLSTGWQALTPLVNVFALIVLVLSTYIIVARLVSGNRVAAFTATLVLISLPIVEFQAFSAYVDLFGTAFLTAALALFLTSRDGKTRSNVTKQIHPRSKKLLLLAALACGVSVGTKPVFWVYAAVFCVVVAVVLVRESVDASELIKVLGLVAVGVLLPSIFWFGRSLQATGNPLFPMQVKVSEHVLLKGFAPSQITGNEFSEKFVHRRAEWLIYPWTEWMRSPGDQLIPYSEGSGTGAAFAAFVPLGILFAAYRVVTGQARSLGVVLLAVWIGLAVVWWVMLQRMPRFGLPLLVLACVLTTPLLEFLQSYRRGAFMTLLIICLIVTGGISGFVPLRELGARARSRAWNRCTTYAYPCLVDALPPGTTLLNNTGIQEANFTLAGSHLSNHVIANFDVPNPITREFLWQRHVDYVVEVVPEQAGQGMSEVADFQPGAGESINSTIARKHWQLWRVTGNDAQGPSKAASGGR